MMNTKELLIGTAAFLLMLLGLGFLVYAGKVNPEILAAPAAAFVTWLMRSPRDSGAPASATPAVVFEDKSAAAGHPVAPGGDA